MGKEIRREGVGRKRLLIGDGGELVWAPLHMNPLGKRGMNMNIHFIRKLHDTKTPDVKVTRLHTQNLQASQSYQSQRKVQCASNHHYELGVSQSFIRHA